MDNVEELVQELREFYIHHPLLLVGALLLVGYFLGRIAARLGLPEILGFIATGLIFRALAPPGVGAAMNESLHIITEIAIGFLALSVGAEFSKMKMRRIAPDIVVITLVHIAVTFAVVFLAFVALSRVVQGMNVGFPYAILLGAMACATAPGIIIAEIRALRARGKFVDYLLGIIALGDALTVLIFGMAFTAVTNLLNLSLAPTGLLHPSLVEAVLSLGSGAVAGLALHLLARETMHEREYLLLTVGTVFVLTGLSIVLHLSPLLVNIVMGATLVNLSRRNQRLFRALEPLTPPIYALFFIIAGIELTPVLFLKRPIILLGLFYIPVRGLAKYYGVRLGCAISRTSRPIARYLGLCLFSQGGIALGFVLLIQTSPVVMQLPSESPQAMIFTTLANIILLSVLINELLSPLFLRYAVVRGNEMEV